MASIYRFSKKKKQDSDAEKRRSSDPSLIMNEPIPEQEETLSVVPEQIETDEESIEKTREICLDEHQRLNLDEAEDKAKEPEIPENAENTRAFDPEAVLMQIEAEMQEEKQAPKAEEITLEPEAKPEETAKSEETAKPESEAVPSFEADIMQLAEADQDASERSADELLSLLQATTEVDTQKMNEVFGHAPRQETEGNDPTTSLLLEMFGMQPQQPSENGPADEELREVFSERRTLKEALEEAKRVSDAEEAQEDSYVAMHNAPEESTKTYDGPATIDDILNSIPPDTAERGVPNMADEVHVPEDPYSDTYEENEERKERRPVLPDEFTAQEEFDEFAEYLRNRNFKALATVGWSLLLFLATLYLESATFSALWHPSFLRPDGIYNIIYLLVDLQLILLSAVMVLRPVTEGARAMFTGKPNRNSIPFLFILLTCAHAVILLTTDTSGYALYGCVASFLALLTAFAEFLEAKRIHRSFRICGRAGEKWVAEAVGADSPEAEAFRDQLQGEASYFSVYKTKFIDGFFRRIKEPSKSERFYGTVILLSMLASLAFAVFSFVKTPDFTHAAGRFMTMAVMTLPLSAVFTVVLPFSHLSRKAEKNNSAIISAAEAEKYASADVVSFSDKEIFPPKSVKVTTIRTYGQTRIDKAILYSAMIFQKLGGPLSLVFKKTISGVVDEIPENFDFLEITADGMCAKIDGKDVFVGNKNYLLSYDFGYTRDSMDEKFEAASGKIMYMVIGSELAAKFYIRYSISKRFKKTILSLYKSGICPAVKTCDPNIDAELFRALLQNNSIPAGIIKTCDAMKDAPIAEHSESTVVCHSTIAQLLNTFTICDSLRHLIRANVVIKLLSALLGIGIVIFLYSIESLTKITGLFALIYQMVWLIPVIIPSLSE